MQMKRYASFLFTLHFAALAFFATAQSVDNVVVTPNPAYSNTPVTVTMQGQLFSSCDYLNNVSASWSGTTLNVYMDFNNTGGLCLWYVSNYEYPLNIGTLSPNNYTVKAWSADYGTLLFTKNFTVVYPTGSGTNGCSNPVQLTCGNSFSGNNSSGSKNYTAYNYNGITQYDYTGPEMIHKFTTGTYGPVTISLAGLSADLDLFLLNACNPSNVIALSGKSGTQSELISTYLSAGTYYIIVDGWQGAVSSYSLSLQCSGGEAQNGCANPYIVQCGGIYQYNNSVGANNYSTWYFGGVPHQYMTGKETIHRLTLTSYTNLTLNMTGLSADLDLYLFSACNNTSGLAFSENAYNQNETIKVNNLAPGTYYVIVDGYNNASSNYTLSVQCSTAYNCQPPSTSQLYVTNLTPTSVLLNCSLSGVQTYYWQYRPLGSGNWIPWGQTTVPYIDVNGLVPNTAYEFQVQVRCLNNFISDWSASQTFTTQGSSINSCNYPALLTCGTTFKYNNSLSSNHNSTYKIGNGYLYGYSGPDVIHRFTINTTTTVTLNLFELSANLGLIVLNACNPNNGIAYSDNTGNLGEIITLTNLPAGTYYVIVDSKAPYIYSNYSLSLSCSTGVAPPMNDEPCGASNIPVYSGCSYTTLTNMSATPTLNPSAAPIACSTAGMNDIWVRFVTPSTGSFSVSTQAGSLNDAVMAAYVGSNNSCTALTYFYCIDNYNSNLMPQVTFINGTPGQYIWLRFWGKNGATGSFTICAQIGNSPQGFAGESDELIVNIPDMEDQAIDLREDVRNEPAMHAPATIVEPLQIYPVPAVEQVTIAGEVAELTENVILRILDINGSLMREQTNLHIESGQFSTTLNISELPNGTYAVTVQAGNKMLNGRFLKVD